MTNLTEIFDVTNPHNKVDQMVNETIIVFSDCKPNMIREIMPYCNDFKKMINELTDLSKSHYTLTNGNQSVNFVVLCEYISSGQLKKTINNIRVIKAELIDILVSNRCMDQILILSFWNDMESTLSFMIS
jgi:hypothetical protein